jgi:hypothetical protein
MTLLKPFPWLLGAAIALSACAKPMEVSSITEIKSTTGSRSIDVLEPKRIAGQAGVPEFAGDQIVEVRTFAFKDGEGRQEVAGATCQLSTSDYTAQLVTPAKVRVPLYRVQSAELAVSCEKPGYARKLTTVSAFDEVRAKRLGSSTGGGVLGVLVVSAVDGMSDNTKNNWKYPPVTVELEALQK